MLAGLANIFALIFALTGQTSAMANTSIYFDTRRKDSSGRSQVKIQITCNSKRIYIPTGISLSPNEWEKANNPSCRDPHSRILAATIDRIRTGANETLVNFLTSGEHISIDNLKSAVISRLFPDRIQNTVSSENNKSLLTYIYNTYMSLKSGKTMDSYRQTLARISAFTDIASLKLDDITRSWLMQWDAFMAKTAPSPNSRAVHMRNLRAVLNFAIDEGLTSNYPFRRFHIKTVETCKRSLSVEQLRALINADVDDTQRPYRDMFLLSFYLIGINFVDMLQLPAGADSSGRIVFNRSKTKKLYSMKVEPEAQSIIDRYRGKKWMLSPLDKVGKYEHYRIRTNKALRTIGTTVVGKHGKKSYSPLFPTLTTYWARHTWATMASELDIPKETISAALGHDLGNPTTAIYINFNRAKIDEANRRVLDWVLYGKR